VRQREQARLLDLLLVVEVVVDRQAVKTVSSITNLTSLISGFR
jgi:hypothetical protein